MKRVGMDDLPEDVIGEILSRLPVKILVGLRCVCKSWRSCISNRGFANLQLRRDMANPDYHKFFIAHYFHVSGWKYTGGHKLYVFKINVLDKPINLNLPLPTSSSCDRFHVVGSCNGLLCLAYLGNQKTKRQNRIYLWNPVNRQLKDIYMKKQNLEHHVLFGFSFDNASNDYKVVSILTDTSHFISRVSVYSLHWNSWKTVEHGKLNVRVLRPCATIVKGLFYWLVEQNSVSSHFGLVSFNVQSGILGTTSLPGSSICHNVFEFKESVAVSTECTYDQSISIWKQDDDRSWIKILTIRNSRIRQFFGCLHTGEFVGQTEYDELALYDPANKVIKYVTNFQRGALRSCSYSASLVHLN